MISLEGQYGGKTFGTPEGATDAMMFAITADSRKVGGEVRRVIRDTLNKVYRTVEAKNSKSFPSGGGLFGTARRGYLTRRTGRGLRSIRDSIVTTGGLEPSGSMSAGEMAIHETGGTVTARGGGYISIPTVYALTAGGRPKKGGPRDWDNTFIRKTTRGNLFVFQKQGKNVKPLYLLRKSVSIKPRLGLTRAFEAAMPAFEESVAAVVGKVFSE